VIGKVGAQTRGVERMLRRVGFRYAERIDPFDGGPHFVAQADEVSLIAATRRASYAGTLESGIASGSRALVARDLPEAPFFKAIACKLEERDGQLWLGRADAEVLGAVPGETVGILPLP
jgi:arginine N-succinyltransferase